jgi:hypothetical protein
MTEFPKHEATPRKRKQPQPAVTTAPVAPVVITGPPAWPATPSIQHDINHVAGLAGIEQSLDCLVSAVQRLTSDDFDLSLSTGRRTDPVKITLADNDYSDTMERLTTAFERIADAVAKLAGLGRPRLEQWHEDVYETRYKDTACDGGAPGPKTASVD